MSGAAGPTLEPNEAASFPAVGVIIPCFNQGQFAAESVGSVLAQDYPNCRAVLLDDASTDGTSRDACLHLAGPRVQVVCLERNLGRSSIRNRGLEELASVEYVLMLDCDDRLSPAYISQLVAALEADAGAGMAYGTLHSFGEKGDRSVGSAWPTRDWTKSLMYLENVIPGPGTMFRATALKESEGWRADFNVSNGEDFDISLQLLELGWRPLWVKDAVFHYRLHAGSFLAKKSVEHRQEVELNILRYHLAGIRATCGVEAYLQNRLMPELLTAVREGHGGTIRRILPPLLRRCPREVLKLAATHYSRRVRGAIARSRPQ